MGRLKDGEQLGQGAGAEGEDRLGLWGMERRKSMETCSESAKATELGDVGGEAEGGAEISLQIWGQILKARKGDRAPEEVGGGGRKWRDPWTQVPQPGQ